MGNKKIVWRGIHHIKHRPQAGNKNAPRCAKFPLPLLVTSFGAVHFKSTIFTPVLQCSHAGNWL